MTETNGFTERRRHKRYKAKDGAFALLKNGSRYKLVQIIDISKGGLSFTYPADDHQIPESFFVDVFFSRQGYYLKEVLSNKVSDVIVSCNFPMSGLILKQIGVQFAELTQTQPSQLERFISNHTIAERNSSFTVF